MSTPPDDETALQEIVRTQIERMRERTGGKLPREEQDELAALLEDLLRSHPLLSRWVRSLLPRPDVAQTAEVLRAAETIVRPDSGRRGPDARVARAGLAGARVVPKKPKKAAGER